jgi:hypothetical protein
MAHSFDELSTVGPLVLAAIPIIPLTDTGRIGARGMLRTTHTRAVGPPVVLAVVECRSRSNH